MHILVECVFAQEAWGRVVPFLGRFMSVAQFCKEDVLLGPRRGRWGRREACAWRVIGAAKEVLWLLRCQHLWHRRNSAMGDFSRLLAARVRDCVLLDVRRGDRARVFELWGITSLEDVSF